MSSSSSSRLGVAAPFKALLAGPARAGKSSILRGMTGDGFEDDLPPGRNFSVAMTETGEKVQLWEMGSGSAIGRSFFRCTDGLLLVVDLQTNPEDKVLESLDEEYDRAKSLVGWAVDDFPCFVLASKKDLLEGSSLGCAERP